LLDQAAHAQAADFLVIGNRQMQRQAQRSGEKPRQAGQDAGKKAFHVRSAAPVKAAVAFGQLKRRYRPCLPVHRHHIAVP